METLYSNLLLPTFRQEVLDLWSLYLFRKPEPLPLSYSVSSPEISPSKMKPRFKGFIC